MCTCVFIFSVYLNIFLVIITNAFSQQLFFLYICKFDMCLFNQKRVVSIVTLLIFKYQDCEIYIEVMK